MTAAVHSPAHPAAGHHVRHPAQLLLTTLRPAARRLLEAYWDLTLYGVRNVPAHGPVVLAANHVGWIDGPLLAIASPRPVHVLTKHEMYTPVLGPLLLACGQVPVERQACDVLAVRTALGVLRHGHTLGVFPEGNRGGGTVTAIHPGAAYFAMVTGAPVVPVAFLGTRDDGADLGQVPGRGTRMAITYGRPVHVPPVRWPRTADAVRGTAEVIRAAMVATVHEAQDCTGLSLPRSVPAEPEGTS